MINIKSSIVLIVAIFLGFSLSGQGTNNANVIVNSPSGIQGTYDGYLATFGVGECEFTPVTAEAIIIEDSAGGTNACDLNTELPIGIVNDLSGKIALIDRDGVCSFVSKAEASKEAGAIAVIICNNGSALRNPTGDSDIVDIPVLMVSESDCQKFKAEISNGVNISLEAKSGSVQDNFANDNVIWGANGEGSFNGDLSGWTTVGISDDSHVWSWSTDGSSRGALFTGPVNSRSNCNGAAIFDFDFIQSGGVVENIPDPPPTISGELISPSIDLSDVSAVAIKFYQHQLPLNSRNIDNTASSNKVSTSIDGGTTWSDGVPIETENVLNSQEENLVGTELIRIPLTGIAGESDVMFKFIANDQFYFWSIDDVQLVELTGNNVSMADAFYTPIAYAVPQAHADSDTFFFSTTVTNSGGRVLNEVRLDVEINDDSGSEVFTTSGTLTSIPIGETTSIAADDLFVPNELPVGKYSIEYNLRVVEDSETDRNDNSTVKIFEITDNLFSKEPGPLDNGFYNGSRPGGEWAAAAVYRMSKNVTDYVATNLITAIGSDASSLTDNFIDVFLLKLNEGVDFANFDFDDTDLQGHPSFDIVSQNTHVFTTEASRDLITVPFSSSGQGVPLEPGESYLVLIRFDGSQAGAAAVPNEELFLEYNTDPRVANILDGVGFISDFVVSKNESRWFAGFRGDPAPVIRMQVEFMSDTDDTPLPVGSFEVFPNPASTVINVNLNLEEPTDATIVMASLDGKILEVKKLTNVSTRKMDMDVSHLPSGTYILKAYTERGSTTHKVVVAN